MSAETLFKVTDPDGHPWYGDTTMTYEAGRTYRRASTGPVALCTSAAIHASRTPEQAAAHGSWPYVLWEVEGVVVEEEDGFKVGCRQVRMVRRLPTHLCWGPNGEAVAKVVEQAGTLTVGQAETLAATWDAARDAAWAVAWDAAWDAARDAAGDAARAAARGAARDAAWAARVAARGAARDAASAAWDAARDAARATVVVDLVGQNGLEQHHIDTLMAPWLTVFPEVAA